MNSKLAILGFVSTWEHAPFDDPEFDIWGSNHIYLQMDSDRLSRVTSWFELHHPEDFVDERDKRIAWLHQEHPGLEIFLHDEDVAERFGSKDPWIGVGPPADKLGFPRHTIERYFRRGGYHCGTFDWQLAYALMLGRYTHIEFHGIHGMMNGEPPSARACFEYWVGVAEGRGVQVHVPAECDALVNIEMRGGQYAYTRHVDGLGVTYLRDGIHWQKTPSLGQWCVTGRKGHMAYLGFPSAEVSESLFSKEGEE